MLLGKNKRELLINPIFFFENVYTHLHYKYTQLKREKSGFCHFSIVNVYAHKLNNHLKFNKAQLKKEKNGIN